MLVFFFAALSSLYFYFDFNKPIFSVFLTFLRYYASVMIVNESKKILKKKLQFTIYEQPDWKHKLETPGNGLKKVLVIGYEGVGKTKICNYLAGYESDVLFYQEGGSSGRGYLQLANVFYRGEEDKPISVIKTPGFKPPNGDAKRSAENMDMITGIVEELKC